MNKLKTFTNFFKIFMKIFENFGPLNTKELQRS